MIKSVFTIIVMFCSSLIFAQNEETINLEYDTSGYLNNGTQLTTMSTPTEVVPTVNSEMNVTESGGLNYEVPIEVIRGINNFQPNLSLEYSSQYGNGMAGWGWNIAGLSTITMGGKSKRIDGITVGRQYTADDPYYLDGQRLLKINTTTYQTEKYSKIKITKETGEYSFTIQYTDGKIAKYKELVSGQHYITLLRDSFDNEIHYTYTVSGNCTYLTKISYGGTSVSNDKFWIDFIYATRSISNKSYRNAVLYTNSQYLLQIDVKSSYITNNGGVYRRYALTYDKIQQNTTERLRKIVVQNETGVSLKPLSFQYNTSSGPAISNMDEVDLTNPPTPITTGLGSAAIGDFDGGGRPYPIYELKLQDNTYRLWSTKNNTIDTYNNSRELFVGRSLRPGNKITLNEVLISLATSNQGSYDKLDFKFYDIVSDGEKTVTFNLPPEINSDNKRQVLSGDYNNDGLIDVLIFQPGNSSVTPKCYFAEIGKAANGAMVATTINFTNFQNKDRYFPLEFNGDGIPEIMILKEVGKIQVFKLNFGTSITIAALSPLISLPTTFTEKTPFFFGDFNGDGLTDFYMPQKVYSLEGSSASAELQKMETEQLYWYEFISTGTTFNSSLKNYTSQKLSYIGPTQRAVIKRSSFWDKAWSGIMDSYDYTEYGASTILTMDVDNDGKTDLVSFKKFGTIKYQNWLWNCQVANLNSFSYPSTTANKIYFHLTKTLSDGSRTLVNSSTTLSVANNRISPLTLLINLTDYSSWSSMNKYTNEIRIHDPITRKEHYFTIKNINFDEGLLREVDNGSSVIQRVEYRPMSEKNATNLEEVYSTSDISLTYPLYSAKNNGSVNLVFKLHTIFDDNILTKEYRYKNAIQSLDGLGFIGFQQTMTSDVYEGIVVGAKYSIKNPLKALWWTVKNNDYNLQNATSSITYGSLDPNFVFSKTIFTNKKVIKGNSFAILNTGETSYDNLKSITVSKNYIYDEAGDLLLNQVNTNFNNTGSTIEKYFYKAEFTDNGHYFFGKINSIEKTAIKGGDIFTTKEEQDYNTDGSLLQKRSYGNGTTPIITDYTYDNYGQINSLSTSADDITPLVTSYQYDSTNRFVWKTTTPDGLISQQNFDAVGKLTNETSPLGLTTSYVYDNWGNVSEITNYLGKKTTISKYQGDTPDTYVLSKTTEGGDESMSVFDKFDRLVESRSKSLNDQWLTQKTEYDIFGKKVKESLPYLASESVKWNTTEYDELDRPVVVTEFTGKITATCYEGLKVTVEDGQKKISKWMDAMGNVIQHQDGGGTIYYKYYANGALKETDYEGIKTTQKIDEWGNKKELNDPSAGIFKYTYDKLNRIKTQTNPKGGVTTYTYNQIGQLTSETVAGGGDENTNISKYYTYDPATQLLTSTYGTYNSRPYTYTTYYNDPYYRVTGAKEQTPEFTLEKTFTYDLNGRVEISTQKTTLVAPAFVTTVAVKNIYDSHGILFKQLDNQNQSVIWEATSINSQGKSTHLNFGNGYKADMTYSDSDLTLQKIKHFKGANSIIDTDYYYDSVRGVLTARNNLVFMKKESFEYDDLNRLTKELINSVVVQQYTYDKRGRMTSNTEMGKYNYNENNYLLASVNFNLTGKQISNNRGFARIKYNSFKSPYEINLEGKDIVSYDFSIMGTRSVSYYGSTNATASARPNRKFYASDMTMEVIKEGTTTKVINYIGGNAYSANYMKIDVLNSGNLATSTKYYLHRDEQATILGITKADGTIVEERYFDAWGNLKAAMNPNASFIINSMGWSSALLIDRGYTGHEHLKTVGLIHMNGRIYDPKLRRFLSPDNFVQDSENTQNFNRYGYVLNNPLLYIDQSGEIITLGAAVLIGVGVAILTNSIINMTNGVPFWYGIGKAGVMGGIQGAISFGIGSVATSTFSSSVSQAAFQAGAHGITGGFMSSVNHGDFISGFASGAVSSVISSGIEGLGTTDGLANSFGKSSTYKAVMIASGGLSGGISSKIAGGNFWQGAQQGIITAGLNHLAHQVTKGGEPGKDYKKFFKSLEDEGLFDYTADYTKVPLLIYEKTISLGSTGWTDANADTFVLNTAAGGAAGTLGYGFKLGGAASTILGAAGVYGNAYSAQINLHYAKIQSQLFYGKITYNWITGEIKNVSTSKVITKTSNVGYRLDTRVKYNLTGGTFFETSHVYNNHYNQNFSNNYPKVGGNVYD